MYRRCTRPVCIHTIFHPTITCAAAWCTSGTDKTVPPKPRRTVRRVMPSDEEMAELHNVDREASANNNNNTNNNTREASILASVAVEPMRFASSADAPSRMRGDPFSDHMNDNDEDDDVNDNDDNDDSAVERVRSYGGMNKHVRAEDTLSQESHSIKTSPPIDILLQQEEEEVNTNTTADPSSNSSNFRAFNTDGSASRIVERQEYLRTVKIEELVEIMVLYLRATENKRLVSSEEEHVIFPVIMDRLNELHVQQMLDIVECHWARSTLVRYGIKFKDMVRDRIAVIATAAAKGAAQNSGSVKDPESDQYNDNNNEDEDADDGAVYIHEVKKNTLDPILLKANDEMNADGVLRCIIVMGMSAGRRKRDLQFFQALGIFLVHHINRYKDPQDLVRVLTAFARAKIIPPKGFLALLGRRFAVLNKRKPLGALPSYRALVNLYKMGHDQMNSFKFLANCIYETIEANIKSEKKQERLLELQRKKEAETQLHTTTNSTNNSTDTNTTDTVNTTIEKKSADASVIIGDLDPQLLVVVRARERFKRLTELKPSMFTKLLLVLARFGAPHQQYLRPTIKPLIIPMLGSFPPPSFSRLLRAMRLFKTTDLELIDPVIHYIVDDIGVANVLSEDLLELLRIISPPDVPVPNNLTKLITLCEQVYSNQSGLQSRPIRPNDMCAVAAVLLQIQRKDEVPLEALDPLTRLMENFALRLRELMKLHVVSLTHVDMFTDICRQQQHPDISGNISELSKARRDVSREEGDDEYYSHLDIDVRETFHKILLVNDYNNYGQYRPTPGVLQVDFKQALTEVSAFDVLEATHLFAQAFPHALQPTVERHLSRSILAKLGNSGEEVITPEHTVVLRPPRELLLTKGDLLKFVELLQLTPLKRVKSSTLVWHFVEEKAKRLKMMEVLKTAQQQQEETSHLSA